MKNPIDFYGTDQQLNQRLQSRINKTIDLTEDEKDNLRKYAASLTSVTMQKRLTIINHICTLARKGDDIDFNFRNWGMFTDNDYCTMQGKIAQCAKYKESYKSELSKSAKKYVLWLFSAQCSTKMTKQYIENYKIYRPLNDTPRDESSIMSEDEIQAIIDAEHNLRWKCFFAVLAEAGCRPSELAALKVEDVQLYEEPNEEPCYVLNITGYKTGGKGVLERKVPLYKSAGLLSLHLQNVQGKTYLFESNKGGALKYQTIVNRFNHLSEIAGIKGKFSLYCYRHTRITSALKHGAAIPIATQTFWGNCQTTQIRKYLHLKTSDIVQGMRGK